MKAVCLEIQLQILSIKEKDTVNAFEYSFNHKGSKLQVEHRFNVALFFLSFCLFVNFIWKQQRKAWRTFTNNPKNGFRNLIQ